MYPIKIYILLKYCKKIKKDRFTATLHIMNLRHGARTQLAFTAHDYELTTSMERSI